MAPVARGTSSIRSTMANVTHVIAVLRNFGHKNAFFGFSQWVIDSTPVCEGCPRLTGRPDPRHGRAHLLQPEATSSVGSAPGDHRAPRRARPKAHLVPPHPFALVPAAVMVPGAQRLPPRPYLRPCPHLSPGPGPRPGPQLSLCPPALRVGVPGCRRHPAGRGRPLGWPRVRRLSRQSGCHQQFRRRSRSGPCSRLRSPQHLRAGGPAHETRERVAPAARPHQAGIPGTPAAQDR
jgi:hypothetical protein